MMIRFVMYWALAGLLAPLVILIVSELQGGVFEWPYLAVGLWPSWIMLGATYEREFTTFGILVLTISIAINVILYSAVGTLVWFLWSLYDRCFN